MFSSMPTSYLLISRIERPCLWWEGGTDQGGNIDPETLPLSSSTIARLKKWTEAFEEDFNWGFQVNRGRGDRRWGSMST